MGSDKSKDSKKDKEVKKSKDSDVKKEKKEEKNKSKDKGKDNKSDKKKEKYSDDKNKNGKRDRKEDKASSKQSSSSSGSKKQKKNKADQTEFGFPSGLNLYRPLPMDQALPLVDLMQEPIIGENRFGSPCSYLRWYPDGPNMKFYLTNPFPGASQTPPIRIVTGYNPKSEKNKIEKGKFNIYVDITGRQDIIDFLRAMDKRVLHTLYENRDDIWGKKPPKSIKKLYEDKYYPTILEDEEDDSKPNDQKDKKSKAEEDDSDDETQASQPSDQTGESVKEDAVPKDGVDPCEIPEDEAQPSEQPTLKANKMAFKIKIIVSKEESGMNETVIELLRKAVDPVTGQEKVIDRVGVSYEYLSRDSKAHITFTANQIFVNSGMGGTSYIANHILLTEHVPFNAKGRDDFDFVPKNEDASLQKLKKEVQSDSDSSDSDSQESQDDL